MNLDSDSQPTQCDIDQDGQVTPSAGFTQFSTRYDADTKSIWCWLNPKPRPCLNTVLLDELEQLQCRLKNIYTHQKSDTPWHFKQLVLASRSPDVYNLGGDLKLFKQYILDKDVNGLQQYANRCIQLLHQNMSNLELPITMIALVQGQALGGGFECALSCDVIIAERNVQMGFPEILFNLFPGMGAYNLLAKRVGGSLAERIILSGRTYSSEELYDMGVIDVLAEAGEGVQATERYLQRHKRSRNTIEAIKKVGKISHPITEQDLLDIVDIWVETAMELTEKDLNKMERLVHAQNTIDNKALHGDKTRSLTSRQGDWRKNDATEFPLITHLGENILHNRRQRDRCRREDK